MIFIVKTKLLLLEIYDKRKKLIVVLIFNPKYFDALIMLISG